MRYHNDMPPQSLVWEDMETQIFRVSLDLMQSICTQKNYNLVHHHDPKVRTNTVLHRLTLFSMSIPIPSAFDLASKERYAFAMPHKDLFEFLSDPSDILNTT